MDAVAANKPLMTIEDLAERWDTTTASAWEVVRSRKVPYLCLSGKAPNLTGKGRRPIRFRAGAIEEWERKEEGVWVEPEIPAEIKATGPAMAPAPSKEDRARKMLGY